MLNDSLGGWLICVWLGYKWMNDKDQRVISSIQACEVYG